MFVFDRLAVRDMSKFKHRSNLGWNNLNLTNFQGNVVKAVFVFTKGGQKNRTEQSHTKPTEAKPIQTESNSISNHSVEDFFNPNGLVLNRTEPRNRFIFCNYLN